MDITRVIDLSDEIRELAKIASADGHQNIETLINEFDSGVNRFNKPGEALFGAYDAASIIGIGGINIDPYCALPTVGRVRRLFIKPDARRSGVATALMRQIEETGRRYFSKLNLRTNSQTASRFYISLGYSTVEDEEKISHEKIFDTPFSNKRREQGKR